MAENDPLASNLPSDEEIKQRLAKAVERANLPTQNPKLDDDIQELMKALGEETLAEIDPIDQKLAELHKKSEELNVSQKVHEVDAEFEQKLKALEQKADRVHSERKHKEVQKTRTLKSDAQDAKGLGIGMSIAYTIIGMPLFGAGLGWVLETYAHLPHVKPICILVGSVTGIAGAVIIMNRTNNS